MALTTYLLCRTSWSANRWRVGNAVLSGWGLSEPVTGVGLGGLWIRVGECPFRSDADAGAATAAASGLLEMAAVPGLAGGALGGAFANAGIGGQGAM
jgi:hypothetical protein